MSSHMAIERSPSPQLLAEVSSRDQPLWTMYRRADCIEAFLLPCARMRVEMRLLLNGKFFGGRRFRSHEVAVVYMDELRQDLSKRGWRSAN